MGSTPSTTTTTTTTATALPLLTLFSLLLLTHASLNLHHSDHEAFLALQRDLGITKEGQRQPSHEPCNTAGVDCERRISDSVPVLRITRIVLESQHLTGFLSPVIGRFTELRQLSLANNHLVDQLPSQIVDCRKLEILNLKNNQFSGIITSELSSLNRLRILDLSSNRFSGNLTFLKYFPNLENLSVADNQFAGKIPVSIRSFRNLQHFDYSGNHLLQGSVPLLKRVKHSSIEVPKRYMLAENTANTKNTTSTAVAPSASSTRSSLDTAQAPSPAAAQKKNKKNKKKKAVSMVLGFLAGIIAGGVSGFVFSLLFKLLLLFVKGGRKDPGPAIFSSAIKKEDLAFLEKDDSLATLQIIGKGGCGEVYKAELPGVPGKMIAIKKIIQPSMHAADLTEEDSKILNKKMRQIRSEIQTVGHIRHRNLLPLLAHVSRPDCHYLVYEFMKNGSLQDMLNDVAHGTKELDWLTRHRIALGVAAGLEYLHLGHNPRIIHRDLKPGNILLDDDMEARIADFGLAKPIPDANTHMTSSNIAGTVGFIAPEYYQTYKFTDKCDIYSFGVMLGVLVMGKLPSDEFFQHKSEIGLVKWMRNVMTSENPNQVIDPNLMGNGYEEQMLLVLKIACFCTLDDPKQRPSSKDIRCMLSQIEH